MGLGSRIEDEIVLLEDIGAANHLKTREDTVAQDLLLTSASCRRANFWENK